MRLGHNLYFNTCVIYTFSTFYMCEEGRSRNKLEAGQRYRSSKQRHILGNTAWTLDQQYYDRMETDNNTK